jgi:hypothetical protein
MLPYAIKGDTIGEVSIKYDPANRDRWTRALRYLLQVLKALIVYVVKTG